MDNLEAEVVSKIQRALNLESRNTALAKRIIDAGSHSISQESKKGNPNSSALVSFKSSCGEYGLTDSAVVSDLFASISKAYGSSRPSHASNHDSSPFSNSTSSSGDRLDSSIDQNEVGGLVVFKKPSTMPVKRASALGLDRLAQQMKHESSSSSNDSRRTEDSRSDEFGSTEQNQKKRLRETRPETPSHPGGIDLEAKRRIEDRRRRDRSKYERLYDEEDRFRDRRDDRDDRRQDDRYERSHYQDSRDREQGRHYSQQRSGRPSDDRDYRNDRDRRDSRDDHSHRSRDNEDERYRRNWRDDRTPSSSSSSTTRYPTSSSSHSDSDSYRRDNNDSSRRRDESSRYRRDMPGIMERTPMGTGRFGMAGGQTPLHAVVPNDDDIPLNEVSAAQSTSDIAFDRDYYDQEEDSMLTSDSTRDPFLSNPDKVRNFENQLNQQQQGQKRISAKANALINDRNRWEEDRLLASGIMQRTNVVLPTDLESETEVRVHLLVHDTKPPFLDGRISFTKVVDPILPVKDATSDVAVLSRKGSKILRETKEEKDRLASLKKYWELEGSKMGNLIGISKKQVENAAGDDDEAGFTDSFADAHLKDPNTLTTVEKKLLFDEIQEKRKMLPIATCKSELLKLIRENNIVVIIGETGSGKTTQMTQYLYEAGYGKNGMIGCTQPRRVAAMSVAKRVAEEAGVTIGGLVGYSIRFEDVTSKETKIRYLTDGVLVRESLTDTDLDQYSVIIMDEAHERALNTDVLFGILKQVARRRADIKLIITSATMDADKFARFFGGVPTFRIPGRTFPVEVLFTKSPIEDYVDAAVQQTLQIHVGRGPGDILIFMTGQEDVEMTCLLIQDGLTKLNGGKSIDDPESTVKPLMILPMYSQLPADLQAKIFFKSPAGIRKVIVATNVAETSLTVDGIFYVIDSGFIKMKVYNPRIGMDALQVFPVSKASADQRAGRAGRTGPGVCYRLFTERIYRDELLLTTVPEIQRTHLANVVLLLKTLGVDNLLDFDFMDPPPQDNIQQSLYQLWVLGALDDTGSLTKLGRKMAEFPLDPALSKMLIVSEDLGCSEEIVTIVSMLSVPTIFVRPKERAEESDQMREKFMVPESDHLTFLFVYQQWKSMKCSARWCVENFIQSKAMRRVQEIREQLVDIMKKTGMRLRSAGGLWDPVREAIASAFFHNAARMKGVGEYVNMRTGLPCYLHPTSSLYGLGYTPEYIVYHELVYTTKEYMQHVTAVDPFWLARVGPMFYSVKESGISRSEREERDRLEKERMEKELAEKMKLDEEEKREQEIKETALKKEREAEIVTFGSKTPRSRRKGLM